MGVLRVRDPQSNTWIDITSSADEVNIGTLDPILANPACELWYDTTSSPGILKARNGNIWEVVQVSEVAVGPIDPYDLNPFASDELFFDTTIQRLMVRVNDNWQPVEILDPNEVAVGAATPTPDVEIWYDTASTDALPTSGILKVKDPASGQWHVATPEEVWVDDQDPLSRGNSEAELWFDLSLAPPVLKANVSGVWVPVQPDPAVIPDEVLVSPVDPRDATTELWVDTSTDPPVLKANVNGVWIPVVPDFPVIPNEVEITNVDPRDATTELWVDTGVIPPTLRANVNGAWTDLSQSEVEIGPLDPYLTPEGSIAELWQDTSLSQNGVLKYRSGGSWRPVAEMAQSEAEISATDPIVYNPYAELWVDISTTPATLRARVNNGWVAVSGPDAIVPEEVNIGPVDPRDATVELWYDTTKSPGTLKANVFGVWEPIDGASEVTVDNIDPYLTDPASSDELWFNPSMGTLSARVNDQWLEVAPEINEVTIQGSPPSNPDVELWHDISTDPPVLKAKIQGLWKPVIPSTADEVYVGPEDPDVVEPDSAREFWYDTDAFSTTGGGFPGGKTNEALVKRTDDDNEVRWGGDLTVPGNLNVDGDATLPLGSVRLATDGQGLYLLGNAGIIKKVGSGLVLRKDPTNLNPKVENNDGTNPTDIITANGAAPMTGILQWPNVTGPKIQLYAATFGIGVESGEACIFGSSKVGFRQNASNGAYFGFVDANTGGGLIIDRDAGDARWAPISADGDLSTAEGDARYRMQDTGTDGPGYIVITGSNGTNTNHYYVNCENNNDAYHFNVLEARKQNNTTVWKLTGYQAADCNAKMYTNLGTEGVAEIWQTRDYGDGQSCLQVHGPCMATHFHDVNRSSAVAGTSAPVDPAIVGRLIDAVKPIAFARTFRSPDATDANEPGFVAPDRDPIPTVGLDFDGVNGDCTDLTERITQGSAVGGYSLGGMLAVAIAEIQSLRARVAQLEGSA